MAALQFILTFLASYICLQLGYTLYLQYYQPSIDPVSYYTAKALVSLIEGAEMQEIIGKAKLQIAINGMPTINILEACNGISIGISVGAFLIAYRGTLKAYLWVVPSSIIALFAANIFRIFSLVMVKQQAPSYFPFFHEYLFPAALYLFAFAIMVAWVKLHTKSYHIV
ncbi:MAG: archaeosortase/exosortase family protein [Bacteroidota bacterium]|nr:archaeosortase/exosortase family protein [Bacteroidota bacterium]